MQVQDRPEFAIRNGFTVVGTLDVLLKATRLDDRLEEGSESLQPPPRKTRCEQMQGKGIGARGRGQANFGQGNVATIGKTGRSPASVSGLGDARPCDQLPD